MSTRSSKCKACGTRTTASAGYCQHCKSMRHHGYKRIKDEGLILDQAGGAWWIWNARGDVLVSGKPTQAAAVIALSTGDVEDDAEEVHATKKTGAQLDAEIAEALGRDLRKTQHIRMGGQMRADKRYTSALKRKINNACKTLCGAEPGHDDYDRATAASFVARFAKLKPEWIADMCPVCRARAGI